MDSLFFRVMHKVKIRIADTYTKRADIKNRMNNVESVSAVGL